MDNQNNGFVSDGPRILLRMEGFLLFLVSLAAYHHVGQSWVLFAVLFLVPDLSMLGYLMGPRIGAIAYNAAHSTIGPIFTIATGFFASNSFQIGIGLIWLAHVGFDRVLGYGLKYVSAFGDTHLGQIGKRKMEVAT